MKKAMAAILAGLVFCGVCATGAVAAGHHGGGTSRGTGVCSWTAGTRQAYTCRQDADGDGLCDVCGAACPTGKTGHHSHGAGHGHCGW